MEPGNYIYVQDGFAIPADLVSIPKRYKPFIDHVLVNHGLLQDRISKLAEDISILYDGQKVTMLVVLKGAFRFAKDLAEAIDRVQGNIIYNLEFIRVKSYENDSQQTVRIESMEKIALENRNIIVIEDLVDSGTTLSGLKTEILSHNPASLRICTLFYKRNPINTVIIPDVIGFSVPNDWIIGYCMDYNEVFRDLNHVSILNEEGKAHFRV
ncbi:hypothetical protein SteCoe_35434 [Stentor coeruleus]|uniref:Phosphoribosyltransferase domain-containing protein n=1 Tax=Stentor coeruleus TaxID=5963 RepID=A0A1R2ASA6_9CILI|nr:hypothetical protein SteCoe_35434 [Stentor coeruleus]